MPEHTRQLLHDLEHWATVLDPGHRDLLDRLDGWLGQTADLRNGQPAVPAIEALIVAVRRHMTASETSWARAEHDAAQALPDGLLSPVPRHSLRGTIDVIAAEPNGLTTAELIEATSGGGTSAVYQRLRLLRGWGLLESGPATGGAPKQARRYTVPAHVRTLLADLDDPAAVSDLSYRKALDELGRLLVEKSMLKDGSPAALRIDVLVASLRVTPTSPLARPSLRAPAKSLLTILTLLGGDGGLTATEVAAAIPGAHRTPVRASIRMLIEWGLVLRDVGGRIEHYGLADGARQLFADIDDPSVDRGAEYRAAVTTLGDLLATRWTLPPRAPSTLALGAVIDAVRAVPGSPLGPVEVQVPITSPRALLDALRAAPDGLTIAELTRTVPRTVSRGGERLQIRLRALVTWQLVRETHREGSGGRPDRVFQLTEQAARLLQRLDAARPGDGVELQELGRLLLVPSDLLPAAEHTARLAAAVGSVRAIRHGPLSRVEGSVREILGLIGAGGGLTAPDLFDMVPGIRPSSMRRRLRTLVGWDLVRPGPDTQPGRTDWSGRLYTLPDHTRRFLADLDDPQRVENMTYRVAIERVALLFDRPLGLMPRSSVTAEVEAALDAVRAAPGNPLVVAGAARPVNSLRDTLEMVAAAPNGVTAAELVERTPGVRRATMHLRLKAFVVWGLVRARLDQSAPSIRRFRYDIPDRMRRILADLDRASALNPDQRAAVDELARLLDGSPSLTATAGSSRRLEAAVLAVLSFYPASSGGPLAIGGMTEEQPGDALASGPAWWQAPRGVGRRRP